MWQTILIAILTILLLYFCGAKIYRSYVFWSKFFKIPGIPGYPIIGNFLDIIEPTDKIFLSDRKRNAENYPIYRMYGMGEGAVTLLSPEDIELVLSNPIHNAKADTYKMLQTWLGTGLLTSEGKKWHTRRKILTPAFHFSILQEFVHVFNTEVMALVEHLVSRKDEPYIDVVKPITDFTLESIGATSLGIKVSDLKGKSANYKNSIYEITELMVYKLTRFWCMSPVSYAFTPTKRKEQKLVKSLHTFSRTVIKNRQELLQQTTKNGEFASYASKKRLAMLDLLLKARNQGANIDEEGIREEVDTFMFEGHDTTAVALCYTLMVLANQENAQHLIYQEITEIMGDDLEKMPSYNDLQEMSFMERCIKESLRLYPSVPFIGRISGEDLKTSTGYVVPKGCDLFIYIYDLHRNSEIYPDPDKFDPDRFLPENTASRHHFAYLPFSAGSRNCIGQRYAILEIKAALCGILRRFKLAKLDTPEGMKFRADLVLRPNVPIRVKFLPRSQKLK